MASSSEDRSVASPLHNGADGHNDGKVDFSEKLQRKWGIGDRKTRDGAPAKRRGPKPDSKPAMTRRQELNRQAQRTHRERKENYMRELEINLDKLKKIYEEDVVRVREENKKLKTLLAAHNIPHEFNTPQQSLSSPTSGIAAPSMTSGYGTQSGFTSPTNANISALPMGASSPSYGQLNYPTSGGALQPRSTDAATDYNMAVQFVSSLEDNCKDHQTYMVTRSIQQEGFPSGHTLNLTSPPRHYCENFGMDDVKHPHCVPELPKADLARLLQLGLLFSSQLPAGRDEITPINAWAIVSSHPAASQLTEADLDAIANNLKPMVVCYGFGAVVPAFQVNEAIENVLLPKLSALSVAGTDFDMSWPVSLP